MMRSRYALALGLGAVSVATTTLATAQECPRNRPTDPGDVAWSYEGAAARSHDAAGGQVRVWYAVEGRHAPSDDTPGDTPSAVRVAGEVAEAALAFFDELGFRAPLGDGDHPACASNGGDGRLDLYLFDFANADGTVIVDRCDSSDAAPCSGFMVVENDFAGLGYESTEVALRTIVPHELFHLVQAAYTSHFDAWWSEGTAQWATKALHPDLQDFESYLPAFFRDVDRPLDFPPSGAAQPFNYGSAIWPQFLDEYYGYESIRDAFDAAGAGTLPTTNALDEALTLHGSSLAEAYVTFAQWNASTGSLAGEGGYENAASYPRVGVTAVDSTTPTTVSGVGAGLSSTYYLVDRDNDATARFEGAAHRAFWIPVVDGTAVVEDAEELPVTFNGRAIVVVAGTRVDKRDEPYTLEFVAPGAEAPAQGSDEPRPDPGAMDGGVSRPPPGLGAENGCATTSRAGSTSGGHAALALGIVLGIVARRRRNA